MEHLTNALMVSLEAARLEASQNAYMYTRKAEWSFQYAMWAEENGEAVEVVDAYLSDACMFELNAASYLKIARRDDGTGFNY